MIGCLRTSVRKQPIIALYFELRVRKQPNNALYFEFETLLRFYNPEASWSCQTTLCLSSHAHTPLMRVVDSFFA